MSVDDHEQQQNLEFNKTTTVTTTTTTTNNDGSNNLKIKTNTKTAQKKRKSTKGTKKDNEKRPSFSRSISRTLCTLKRCNSDLNVLNKVRHYDDIDRKVDRKHSLRYGEFKPQRCRSASVCRITGHSIGMEEPHYFPSKNDFPYFGRRSSCQITYKHNVLGDKFHFPVFDPTQISSGTSSTESVWGPIPNEFQHSKRALLFKEDSSEDNPSEILKKRFKEKTWKSDEEKFNQNQKSPSPSSPTTPTRKRSSHLVPPNETAGRRRKSNVPMVVDINNNPVINHEDNHMNESIKPKKENQVYEVILDYKPPRSATDEISLKAGQEVVVLSKDKPHKWKVRTRRTKNFTKVEEGFAPSAYLKPTQETVENTELGFQTSASTETDRPKADQTKDLNKKKDMIVRELIETEEDLIRDMQFVVRTYIRQSESSITPKEIKAVKSDLFAGFKELMEFHKDVLLKNFQTLSKEPSKIGALFLKLKSEFDNHSKYCQNLPKALAILEDNSDVSEFFNNYAVKIRDEKSLAEHLKLPLQRLGDYQLLLKELAKNLARQEEEVTDLEKAVKFIGTVPDNDVTTDDNVEALNRAAIDSLKTISDFKLPTASSEKLSEMLKNVLQSKDFFQVIDAQDLEPKERFIFLFKSRMFITEINKNLSQDQRSYNVEKIIKLPEVDVELEDSNTILIKSKDSNNTNFPVRLKSDDEEKIKNWLDMIKKLPKSLEDESEPMMVETEKSQPITESEIKPVSSTDENNNKVPKRSEPEPEPVSEESFQAKKVQKLDTGKTEKPVEKPAKDNPGDEEDYSITNQMKSVTRHFGETALLQCQVSPGTVNVQWLKDNQPLSGSNYKSYKKDDVYFLELNDLTPEQSGIYTFVASNLKKSVASSSTVNVLMDDSRPTSPGGSFLPHPPKFKVKLKDTELLEGATVRFELIVRGLPVPSITIYKDGKILREDDHLKIIFQSKEVFEIVIEHVRQEDAGIYKCVAVNMEGEDETSGRITVVKDKNVFIGLDDNPITIDSPRCGSPMFKWFKDGKEFEASERFQVQFDDQEDTVALIFQHVTPGDAGLYTCVASTSSGKISCNAELNVQGVVSQLPKTPAAPKFMKDLANVQVKKGESVAILEAQICGYPKPVVTWYKENRLLESSDHYKMVAEGEENFALLIKNVTEDDAGKYKLKATNKLGEAEEEAELVVVKAPELKATKEKIEVAANESVIIEQKFEAFPPPEVIWKKDGKEIKASDRIKTVIEPDKNIIRLVIDKATSEDVGKYTCSISNNLGSASKDVDVIVKSPAKILRRMEAATVSVGETAIFTAQCAGITKANVEFYKENKLIKESERIQIRQEKEDTFSLIIKDCNEDDQGKYKLKIKNDYGYDEDEASLVVQKKSSKPEFKENLKNLEANLGDENVKLAVKVDGEPRPQCEWYHNGKKIDKSNDLFKIIDDDKGSTLVIPKVMEDHQGKFTCKSINANGTSETEADLVVKSAPYVVKHLENVESCIGMDAELTAIIKGNPKPQIKWFCDDKEIKLTDRKKYEYDEASAQHTLVIRKFQAEDAGQYKIEAKNSLGQCTSTAKLQVASKPIFSKVLKDVHAKEMESNIEMAVQIGKEVSKPLVKWFKDDKEIKDDDSKYRKIEDKLDNSYKLVILKASEETVGKYKCVASNEFGTTETAARFDIITKPSFIKGMQDIEVMEGNNVSMTVQIAGCPKPEVSFYKDGEEVSAEAKIQIKKEMDDIYQLEIENIRIIMSGEYECRIKNEAGEATSKGVIIVNSQPDFLKNLKEDVIVNVSDDIVLEVKVTGRPSPELKWFVNGKETPGSERIIYDIRDESYSMKIPNAQESDTGIYHCVAKNKFGEKSSNKSNVKVVKKEEKPTFSKPIKDSIVVVGDNVRFDTVVSAVPAATVTWLKDSQPLKPSDKVIIKSDPATGEQTLIIKDLQPTDSGVITCRAENPQGIATQAAKLEVHEPTPPTISDINDKTVVEGEPVRIEAIVTGLPKPIVQWFKDGQLLHQENTNEDEPIKNEKFILELPMVKADMAGTYTCRAHNCAGTIEQNFQMDICGKKPSFVKELEETQIVMSMDKQNNRLKLGQSAIFETVVDGVPTPDVKWLKNDKQLTPSPRVLIEKNDDNEHRLEIKSITKDDVAKYTCKAENKFGEAQSVCLLKFLNEPHEPIIQKPLESVRVEEGDDLKLFCKVDGEPMPAVHWFKDSQPLETSADDRLQLTSRKDGSTSLIIEKVAMTDSGKYEVQAENAKGTASTSADVSVVKPQRPPTFPEPLKEQIKVDIDDTVILEAVVFGLPPPTVQWLKDGKPIKDGPRTKMSQDDKGKCQLKIDHVKKEDAGSYSLQAKNENGQAQSCAKVQVGPESYAPLIVENLPTKIQVAAGEPIKMQAKIDSYPPAEITWNKDKVPLAKSDRIEISNQPEGQACLSIKCSEPQDQGVYQVMARNQVGETSTSTLVEVASPVSPAKILVKDLPEKMELAQGSPLVLSAKLENVPNADIQWVKDGKVLRPDGDAIKIQNDGQNCQLIVDRSKVSDSGIYELVVQTPESRMVAKSQVLVEAKPSVATELRIEKPMPNEQSVVSGEDLNLGMKLNAKPLPTDEIRIYKDDKLVRQISAGDVEKPQPQTIDRLPSRQESTKQEPLISSPIEILDSGEIKFSQSNCTPIDSGLYRIEILTQPNRSLSSSCLVKVSEKDTAKDLTDDTKKIRFKRELAPVEVPSGSPCRLECALEGNPSDFDIRWYKDDEELMPGEHYGFVKEPNGTLALLIDSVAAKDVGAYTVRITAGTGASQQKASTTGQVSLAKSGKIPPSIVEGLHDTKAEEGSPLCLKCQVAPDSLPAQCKWMCNGKELKETDAIQFLSFPDGTFMLQIGSIQPSDAGKYQAIITNGAGDAKSEAAVSVQKKQSEAPTIKKGLEPTTLIAGQPGQIELQLTTGGPDDGDIKFLLGSEHVIPDDRIHVQRLPDGTVRLKFDMVTLNDAGNYTAIITNAGGSVQTSAPVTVKSKPIIVKGLEDTSVKEKCSVRFEAQIAGNPTPDVTWLKNASAIKPDGKHLITGQAGDNIFYLTINECTARDKADYSVKAVNELGSAVSKAKLSLIFGSEFEECSPSFTEMLHDVTAGIGDTVQMKAKIKAHPVPKIVWKKDGQEITMNPEKIFTNFDGENLELNILNFGTTDQGLYEVCVENSLGQTTSAARLSEHPESEPKFVKKLTDLQSAPVPTKLTCKAEGYPTPEIKWFYNGKQIESGAQFNVAKEFGEQVLHFYQPTEADSGVYECLAENRLGSDRTSANVLFTEKDKEAVQFLTKLQDCDVPIGETARFTACVIGNPKPEIKWFKDDQEIKIDGSKYYFELKDNGMVLFEVRNAQPEDMGRYRCFASNKYGNDNSIGQLNIETVDELDRMQHKSKKGQQRIMDADAVEFQTSGLPNALTEKPVITKMIDDSLTLLWIPSIPEQPRFPVSYVVEFCKVSDGNWMVYHGDIKDIKCDVVGLEPYEDYSFRVRVENKFGQSEPSPVATAFRSKLRDRTEAKPKSADDFVIEHKPLEKNFAAPTFLREEPNFIYGALGLPVTIEFWTYGLPDPEITWYFGDEKIEHSGQFQQMRDRNGRTCLFIDRMTDANVGTYTCVAKNEHGEDRRTIKLTKSVPPRFTKLLEETTASEHNHFRLRCSVEGFPEPTVKWYKDYQPLHDTSRVKVLWEDGSNATIIVNDTMLRDTGLYSCTATNVAGSSTTSAYVRIKEEEISFDRYASGRHRDAIKAKNKKLEQFYDVGDELGRGTQGVTYHVVERTTGNSYAAKMMTGTGEMRHYMTNELEMMNQIGEHQNLVQLQDCFASTPYSMSLITNLCGGGTLLDHILKKGSITEQEVADYVKQILEGLHHMHMKNIGHFGLTIGDILLARLNGSDVTICDFGLAQRVAPGSAHFVEFGQPEFVSPEIVSKNSVTLTTDVWSAGIITYILLTGISPFLGENDRATMYNIQDKKLDLSDEKLGHISEQGRDFLRKALNFDQRSRLDVTGALNHPWISGESRFEHRLDIMEKLREYKSRNDRWYQNASCRRYYRRRALHSCYTHPSRMIYPPDEQYSPLISPEREMRKFQRSAAPFENIYPRNQNFASENFVSESHYQCGPDTYLLQLRDTAFPARIRRYLRTAANYSPSVAASLSQAHWGSRHPAEFGPTTNFSSFSQVSVKERRKFTDIMDEEIQDEINDRSYLRKPRRLAREVGTPLYHHAQLKILKRETTVVKHKEATPAPDEESIIPFFREKLKEASYTPEDPVVLTCYAVGIPQPTYTWFRNDSILIETDRVKVKRIDDGRCQLIISPSKEYDAGMYKCVARNTAGSVVCRARLTVGVVPAAPAPPHINDFSAHEALLLWSVPKISAGGDAYVKSYKLEKKKIDDGDQQWSVIGGEISQEFFIVTQLEPNESYHFRLSACNKYGWSEPSAPSHSVKMAGPDETKTIVLPPAMQYVCTDMSEVSQPAKLDYQIESVPVPLIKSEFKELYDFKSIIAQGKFSVISRAYVKDGSKKTLACKCVLSQSETESAINNEYEIAKSLAHEKIARLHYANRDANLFTLAMEMCCGLNILTYLGRRHSYTEQTVAVVLCQVLDAIEYLHFREIGLLELQPDNILVVEERSLQIKLTDFCQARYVPKNCAKVNIAANPEFIAPELIRTEEAVLPFTDVWTVGVLAYILLSGHSPFRGSDAKETAQNVVFVRYLFERLYPNVTQESIRFLLAVFKLTAHKRPSIEECFESKWLLPSEFMIRKRESAIFDTVHINRFAEEFFREKSASHSRLLGLIGVLE